jgi:nucleotide-binding universal stress UspA family protein
MIPDIKKILHTTDMSENARYAFGYAMSLANRYRAGIATLYMVEDASAFRESMLVGMVGESKWKELLTSDEEKILAAIRNGIETFCEEAKSDAPACPFVLEDIIVRIGNPVEEIKDQIDQTGADLIVMGAHGQGTLADKFIGSTSRRMLRRCKRPVLLVRMPKETEA